ncbi:interferon regulatory factor 7 isoform 2-T2 [Amazona ochrocephala]
MAGNGDAPKLRFGPWLLGAVASGVYRGLCWTDMERRAFRVPWKHNSRKDVTSSDQEIFKAWAKASGRYEEHPENPVKWKTNFRCALKSTRMFVELEDHSRCGDDPHKVFAINPDFWHVKVGDFNSLNPAVDQQLQLQLDPQDVAPEIAPPGCADPLQTLQLEELQLVLQQCGISPDDLGPPTPSWALAGAVTLPCHQPEVPVPVPTPQEVMLLNASTTAPVPPPEDNTGGFIPDLNVSIYYRGKLVHQEEVVGSRCLLVYQSADPAVAELPGRLVHFPSPARLADRKQLWFTEELLHGAGLQLEHRAHKLFATRLKRCKVFWALSRQLEGIGDLPPNPLVRNEETPIFDFTEFCTELREFRNDKRKQSPDFTIYLCFGQSLSVAKPKKSKLILVKLVPKFCEYWYEQVLREGASSLDSGTVSLQLSNSFSLFELIEQYNMQLD